MRTRRLFCLALVFGMLAVQRPASGESAALTKFKEAATSLVDGWLKQIGPFEKELAKATDDLAALKKKSPPPPDLDKQVRRLQLDIDRIQALVRHAADTAKTDYGVLTIESSDPEEVKQAEAHVLKLLTSKGLLQNKYIGFKVSRKTDAAAKTTAFTFTVDFR
jgi:hypothetical protein